MPSEFWKYALIQTVNKITTIKKIRSYEKNTWENDLFKSNLKQPLN